MQDILSMYRTKRASGAVFPAVASTTGGASSAERLCAPGIALLHNYMRILSLQARRYLQAVQTQGRVAIEAQKQVAAVDAKIAQIDLDENHESVFLDGSLNVYLERNPSFLEGMDMPTGIVFRYRKWKKEHLVRLRGRIQQQATRNQDEAAQSNTQANHAMQIYHVSVSMINSLQTLLGDMNRMVAQSTRW